MFIGGSLVLVGLGLGFWWYFGYEEVKRTKFIFMRMIWVGSFNLLTTHRVLSGRHLIVIIILILAILLIFSILKNFVMDSINNPCNSFDQLADLNLS